MDDRPRHAGRQGLNLLQPIDSSDFVTEVPKSDATDRVNLFLQIPSLGYPSGFRTIKSHRSAAGKALNPKGVSASADIAVCWLNARLNNQKAEKKAEDNNQNFSPHQATIVLASPGP